MSTYTDELRKVASDLAKEGWDRRYAIISHAADRMDSMEELIIALMKNDSQWEKGEDTNSPIADW